MPIGYGAAPGMAMSGLKPARGGLILALGIVSLFCCGIVLGLVAFFMGSADLKAMAAGQMDPSGRGMTNAGRILGLIGVVLSVLYIVLAVTNGNWQFNVG